MTSKSFYPIFLPAIVLLLAFPIIANAAGQTDYVLFSDKASEKAHEFRQYGTGIERCGGAIGLKKEFYSCRVTPVVNPEPRDLALNRTRAPYPRPSASSTFPGYDLWGPIADSGSSWCNDFSDPGDTSWSLDFGKPIEIGKVILKTWQEYPISDFDLLRWDDRTGDWDMTNPIARIRGNTAPFVSIPGLRVTSRKIRVLCLSGPPHQTGFKRIAGISVYPPTPAVKRFEPRWMSFRVKTPIHGKWTLEVQEVNDDRFNGDRTLYRILVDGKSMHLRDYSDNGPGLFTYFVDLPPTGKSSVTVTLKDTSGYGMRICSVRAYSEFDQYCRENRMMVPMMITQRALNFNVETGISMDLLDRWIEVFKREGAGDKIGFVADIAYLQKGPEYVHAFTEAISKLMIERKVPLVLGYTTWWGYTPLNTPDGKGGTFSDIEYQQIGFSQFDNYHDPGLKEYMDRCKPGWYDVRYGLTIPNHWSSTPWLTMNNKTLNVARQEGLIQSMRTLNPVLTELERRGLSGKLLGIIGDDEPVYWTRIVDVYDTGYGRVNNGAARNDLMLDFNWSVIQDAARDGIVLDPADGLDPKEKQWLHLNPAHYNKQMIGTIRRNLRKPAIRVDGDRHQFPIDDHRENLFAYITGGPGYPLEDRFHPIWETEVFDEAGLGLGWIREDYERGRELGRVANSDFECVGAEDVTPFLPRITDIYEGGALFTHFTNPGAPENWTPVARLIANPTRKMDRARMESLLIIWRRNAQDRINDLRGKPGVRMEIIRNAQRLLDTGFYRDAFEEALKARSILLPATYRVQKSGRLWPYEVSVVTDNKSQPEVTIVGLGKELCFRTDSPAPFRLSIGKLPTNYRIHIRQTDQGPGFITTASTSGRLEVEVPTGRYTIEYNKSN
ncbi:MAG: hypothetical protein ACYC0V_13245 [Armatimonadota bacterium]